MSDQREATYGPKQTTIKPWPKTDWCFKIHADDKTELLAILANGTVRGSIEDAGPAAHRFVAELRGLTEAIRADAKAEALQEAADALHSESLTDSHGPYSPGQNLAADWLRARADKLVTE